MEGEKVEVILHTAILVPESDDATKNPYLEPVLKLKGQVLAYNTAGISLKISECLTEKNQKMEPPHENIFLPLHKIDHLYLLG